MDTFWLELSVFWPFGAVILYLLAVCGTAYILRPFCEPGQPPHKAMAFLWPISLPILAVVGVCFLAGRWFKRDRGEQ